MAAFKQLGSTVARRHPFCTIAQDVTAAQQLTLDWVERCVIELKLCPWAAPVRNKPGALNIAFSNASDIEALKVDIYSELTALKANLDQPIEGGVETTLVTVPAAAGPGGFLESHRDMVHAGWEIQSLIEREGLVSEVLLVLFHPTAVHSLYDDPRDTVAECKAYSLRSPYPTFHLLRQKDILAGVTSGMPSPDTIPERNSARLQKMGVEALRAVWAPLLARTS